jgi:hypothetical protein
MLAANMDGTDTRHGWHGHRQLLVIPQTKKTSALISLQQEGHKKFASDWCLIKKKRYKILNLRLKI